ncbi:MAG TPA: DUF11 domain-containing protein [Acidimicrobiales bacterium]
MRSYLAGRIATTALLVAGTAAAVGMGATIAASPAGAAAGQVYGGSATGNLVGVTAVTVPGTFQAANVQVGPTTAQAASAGGLSAAPGKNSYAHATNLNADLISGKIPIDNLLVQATQSAPPDNPTPNTAKLASVPADPLLNATVATALASARWAGPDSCVPVGLDIAHGTSTVATANVLTGTPAGAAVVSLVNGSGGPVTSDSSVQMINVPGQTGNGLESIQADQLTGIVLFKGSANELTINVLAPPKITAVATGAPGGASVTYTEPILQVIQGGKVLGTLDAATAHTSLTIPGLATLSLGTLTKTVAADGTSASGSANLLNVQIGVAPLPLSVATVTVAGGSVAASVPKGGVLCPNPLGESHKDSSTTAVAPGQSFNYTISVPNRSICVLDPVTVTDTITAPPGTTVTSTPKGTPSSSNPLALTWNIGPLQPNQTTNITLVINVPPDAPSGFVFSDQGTVSGTCQGAPAGTPPFTQPISFNGPTVFTPGLNGCHLNESNKAADHLQVFPGETFNYYIHVLNDGNQACSNVTVSDPLGSGVSFVSASNGGSNSGGTVTWTIPSVGPGQSVTLTLEVQANPSDTAGMTLPDHATITATEQPGGVPVSTNGPTVTSTSVLAPASPASPGNALGNGSGNGTLPRTGGQPLAPYGLGLLIAGAVALGWRRRTHPRT